MKLEIELQSCLVDQIE